VNETVLQDGRKEKKMYNMSVNIGRDKEITDGLSTDFRYRVS